MKKTIVVAFSLMIILLSGCSLKQADCDCPTCPPPEPEKSIQKKVIEAIQIYRSTAGTRSWDFYFVEGYSMEEYGFHNNSYVVVELGKCEVGDFCIIQCISKKCKEKILIKKVIQQEDNKYWFQGNKNRGTCPEWVVGETNCESFDSRDFGWLTEDIDFSFFGSTSLEDQMLTL